MRDKSKSKWTAGFPLLVGSVSVLLLFGVFGYWGTQARLSGAVIASGKIEVESQLQSVQHLEGGMVHQINVRDGDKVSFDEVLFRLDDTAVRSELIIIETQLLEVIARRARLEAERDASTEYEAPLLDSSWIVSTEAFNEKSEGQRRLFDFRKQALLASIEQFDQQQAQLEFKIEGASIQMESLDAQGVFLDEFIDTTASLVEKQLMKVSRLTELKIEKLRVDGEIGRLFSEIAESKSQISSLDLQKIDLRRQYREQAMEELNDVRHRVGELSERRLALAHRLNLLAVKSPVAGVVHNMSIASANSVIKAGENVMFIVPEDQDLVIKARISAQDRDSVILGGETTIRFPSLDQKTTPEISGHVQSISADSLEDQSTGQLFYEAIVIPEADQLQQIKASDVLVGIPTEVYVKTVDRSPVSYLVKPLEDFFVKALRES